MRLIGTFHLPGQFFGCDLAGGNLGTAKCLDEVAAAQSSNLGARPLSDQTAAVQVNRRRKTDLSVKLFGAWTTSKFRSMAQWRSRSDRYIGCLCGLAYELNSVKRNRNDLSVRQRDFRFIATVFKYTTFDKTVNSLSLRRFARADGRLIVPTAVIDRSDADVLCVVG